MNQLPTRDAVTPHERTPSLRLQIATAYLGLGGGLITVSGAVHLVTLSAASVPQSVSTQSAALGWGLAVTIGISWLYASWSLHRHKRSGAWSAALALLATVARPLAHGGLAGGDVVFALSAALLLASIWRELEE